MFLKSLFIYKKCFNFSSPTEPACVPIRSFVITRNDTFPIQISIKVMPELSGSRCPSAHKWNDLLISFHHHSCTHSALGGDENCLSKIWQGGVAVGAHINLHAFIATTTKTGKQTGKAGNGGVEREMYIQTRKRSQFSQKADTYIRFTGFYATTVALCLHTCKTPAERTPLAGNISMCLCMK